MTLVRACAQRQPTNPRKNTKLVGEREEHHQQKKETRVTNVNSTHALFPSYVANPKLMVLTSPAFFGTSSGKPKKSARGRKKEPSPQQKLLTLRYVLTHEGFHYLLFSYYLLLYLLLSFYYFFFTLFFYYLLRSFYLFTTFYSSLLTLELEWLSKL